MTTNDPRVDKLVDAIYVEGARKNEVSPAFHLDDAINSWVAGIVLRGFDDSGVCGCEDCPSRPEWHRDLDSMFDIVTPLRNRLEATARRAIHKALSDFAAKHPEAPWDTSDEETAAA